MMKPKYGYPPFLNHIAIWMIIITPLTKFGLCSRPLHIAVEGFLNLAPAAAVVAPPPPPPRPRTHSISHAFSSAISQTLSNVATSDYVFTDDSGLDLPKTPIEPVFTPEVDTVKESSKGVLRMVSRGLLTAGCVVAAIVLPGFEKVMAFLGSFSAFLICIILPVSLSTLHRH
jgi:vesicular inhibitory amino acid transporter